MPSSSKPPHPFVPVDFVVPERLETPEFRLRPLTVHDVVKDFDAEVYLWARQSELAGGLDAKLYAKVQAWIEADWPFKGVAFPGRSIDWPAWRALPFETS